MRCKYPNLTCEHQQLINGIKMCWNPSGRCEVSCEKCNKIELRGKWYCNNKKCKNFGKEIKDGKPKKEK